jgi:hypothetical protein
MLLQRRDLIIPGLACVWSSKLQLGRKNVALFICTPNVESCTCKHVAVSVHASMSSRGVWWQVIHSQTEHFGKLVAVSQCCFEANRAECWLGGSSNRDSNMWMWLIRFTLRSLCTQDSGLNIPESLDMMGKREIRPGIEFPSSSSYPVTLMTESPALADKTAINIFYFDSKIQHWR